MGKALSGELFCPCDRSCIVAGKSLWQTSVHICNEQQLCPLDLVYPNTFLFVPQTDITCAKVSECMVKSTIR